MTGSTYLTEKQKEELGIPGVETKDDILRLLPESISDGGYSFGFIFGHSEKYYAGYQRFDVYLDDYISWSEDPLECLYSLLIYILKRSKKAYN